VPPSSTSFGKSEKARWADVPDITLCHLPWVFKGTRLCRAITGQAQARACFGFQSRPPLASVPGLRAAAAVLHVGSLGPARRWVGLCVRTSRPSVSVVPGIQHEGQPRRFWTLEPPRAAACSGRRNTRGPARSPGEPGSTFCPPKPKAKGKTSKPGTPAQRAFSDFPKEVELGGTPRQGAFSEVPGAQRKPQGGTCPVRTCARIASSRPTAPRTSALPGTPRGRR